METITEYHNWIQFRYQQIMGSPAPNACFYIIAPESMAPSLQKSEQKNCKDIYCKSVPTGNDYISKTEAIAISTGMLIRHGDIFTGVSLLIMNSRQW